MRQQRESSSNNMEHALNNDPSLLTKITDPLNNEPMLPLLERLGISSNGTVGPKGERLTTYLINSKNFNARKFLGDIHSTDTFEGLNQSLNNLDRIIESQAGDLQYLVQNNFTNYVKIKNRLNQIYDEFSENLTTAGSTKGSLDVDLLEEKVDESIRKANSKLKPLLDTSTKIDNYNLAKRFIEENKEFFNLTKVLKRHAQNRDFSSLIAEYRKGQEMYNNFKAIRNKNNDANGVEESDGSAVNQVSSVPQIIDRIWSHVEEIINSYRQETWDALLQDSTATEIESQDFFLPQISKLLDLNVEESPVFKWINFKIDSLEEKLNTVSSHLLKKIIKAQGNILSVTIDEDDVMGGVDLNYYLSINQLFQPIVYQNLDTNGTTTTTPGPGKATTLPTVSAGQHSLTDSPVIIEMWLLIIRYIDELEALSRSFIDLWEHIEHFLDGTYQSSIINDKKKDNILTGDLGVIDNFKNFLNLDKNEVRHIESRGETFIKLFFANLSFFFQSTQESLSTFGINTLKDYGERLMKPQQESKDTGNPVEYGFVPPRANGLSCLRYLPLVFEPFLRIVTRLAQLGINSNIVEMAKQLSSIVIDRCIGAISSNKLRDISNFYILESWELYSMVKQEEGASDYGQNPSDLDLEYGITQFSEIVLITQQYSIKVIRDLLFSFEKLPIINNIAVLGYPSKHLLTGIEIQQIISMEAVLEAILKNAAKDKDAPRNSRTILTLTNLQYIREYTFPMVLRYFDDSFDWNLRTKPLEIFNLLGKMESSILGNYLSDLKVTLRDILEENFQQIDWINYTSNSFRVNDYIVESLMLLTREHSDCFRIGPQLINRIIRETQLFVSRYLFEAFKPYVGRLPSDGLSQVTVDLKFFQRVLGNLLEKDTEATLTACLQNCFQNNFDQMNKYIKDTESIVTANIARTTVQFAAFK